jgi:hypothetical protein
VSPTFRQASSEPGGQENSLHDPDETIISAAIKVSDFFIRFLQVLYVKHTHKLAKDVDLSQTAVFCKPPQTGKAILARFS